jgi:hypothetical protein
MAGESATADLVKTGEQWLLAGEGRTADQILVKRWSNAGQTLSDGWQMRGDWRTSGCWEISESGRQISDDR